MMNIRLRHIALLVMMAVCFGSCDHDAAQEGGGEVPVPENLTPIAFKANQGEEGAVTRAEGKSRTVVEPGDTRAATPGITRADKGLEELLPYDNKTFKVWAFKNAAVVGNDFTNYQTVIDGYTVRWTANSSATTTTNTHDWEYVNQQPAGQEEQTIKYWDWNAGAYRFFGYAGSGVTGTLSPTRNDFMFTFTADASDPDATPFFSHLWFSTPDDESTFGKAVTLEFRKPFAMVRFIFRLSGPDDDDITLEEKYFSPTDNTKKIYRKGTFTVSYPLKGTQTKETCSYDTSDAEWLSAFTEDYEPDNSAKIYTKTNNGWYTVLPAVNQGSYTLDVRVNGYLKTCVVPAEYMNWQSGYQYTYIFKITEEHSVEIDLVQSAFTGWHEVIPTEHKVYNW